jgi:hypothetical protein
MVSTVLPSLWASNVTVTWNRAGSLSLSEPCSISISEAVVMIRVETRELYSSPNGHRWLLCRESDTDRVFVRHEPNLPSGGRVSDLDIGAFLSRGPLNPEHQALLRLFATLIDE